MTPGNIAEALLLVIGVAGFAVTSIAIFLFDNPYDQIHFLAPGSLIGSVAVPLAVLIHEGLSQTGVKAIVIAFLLFISNPALSHATARAARIRRQQKMAYHGRDVLPAESKE